MVGEVTAASMTHTRLGDMARYARIKGDHGILPGPFRDS